MNQLTEAELQEISKLATTLTKFGLPTSFGAAKTGVTTAGTGIKNKVGRFFRNIGISNKKATADMTGGPGSIVRGPRKLNTAAGQAKRRAVAARKLQRFAGDSLVRAGQGAAIGGGVGFVTAPSGQRLEGAKRGAIGGAIISPIFGGLRKPIRTRVGGGSLGKGTAAKAVKSTKGAPPVQNIANRQGKLVRKIEPDLVSGGLGGLEGGLSVERRSRVPSRESIEAYFESLTSGLGAAGAGLGLSVGDSFLSRHRAGKIAQDRGIHDKKRLQKVKNAADARGLAGGVAGSLLPFAAGKRLSLMNKLKVGAVTGFAGGAIGSRTGIRSKADKVARESEVRKLVAQVLLEECNGK